MGNNTNAELAKVLINEILATIKTCLRSRKSSSEHWSWPKGKLLCLLENRLNVAKEAALRDAAWQAVTEAGRHLGPGRGRKRLRDFWNARASWLGNLADAVEE